MIKKRLHSEIGGEDMQSCKELRLEFTTEFNSLPQISDDVWADHIFSYLGFTDQVKFRLLSWSLHRASSRQLSRNISFMQRLTEYLAKNKNSLSFSQYMQGVAGARAYQLSLREDFTRSLIGIKVRKNEVVQKLIRRVLSDQTLFITYLDGKKEQYGDSYSSITEFKIYPLGHRRDETNYIQFFHKTFKECSNSLLKRITFETASSKIASALGIDLKRRYNLLYMYSEGKETKLIRMTTEKLTNLKEQLGSNFTDIDSTLLLNFFLVLGDMWDSTEYDLNSIRHFGFSNFQVAYREPWISRQERKLKQLLTSFEEEPDWGFRNGCFAHFLKQKMRRFASSIILRDYDGVSFFMQPYERAENNQLVDIAKRSVEYCQGSITNFDGVYSKIEFNSKFVYKGAERLEVFLFGYRTQEDDYLATRRRTNKRIYQNICLKVQSEQSGLLVFRLTNKNDYSVVKRLMNMEGVTDTTFIKLLLGIGLSCETKKYCDNLENSFEALSMTKRSYTITKLQASMLAPISYNPMQYKNK